MALWCTELISVGQIPIVEQLNHMVDLFLVFFLNVFFLPFLPSFLFFFLSFVFCLFICLLWGVGNSHFELVWESSLSLSLGFPGGYFFIQIIFQFLIGLISSILLLFYIFWILVFFQMNSWLIFNFVGSLHSDNCCFSCVHIFKYFNSWRILLNVFWL